MNRSLCLGVRRTCMNPVHIYDRAVSSRPIFSQGEDKDKISAEAEQLLGRWRLSSDSKGLERSFHFKGFKQCWTFMNAVAEECKAQRHHPEWTNIYNRVHIKWTTHRPEGLSSKDILMARFCDSTAQDSELTGSDQQSSH